MLHTLLHFFTFIIMLITHTQHASNVLKQFRLSSGTLQFFDQPFLLSPFYTVLAYTNGPCNIIHLVLHRPHLLNINHPFRSEYREKRSIKVWKERTLAALMSTQCDSSLSQLLVLSTVVGLNWKIGTEWLCTCSHGFATICK